MEAEGKLYRSAGSFRLADAVIQADGSLIAGLSREDLELLLS